MDFKTKITICWNILLVFGEVFGEKYLKKQNLTKHSIQNYVAMATCKWYPWCKMFPKSCYSINLGKSRQNWTILWTSRKFLIVEISIDDRWPWMTPFIKQLINDHQKAFYSKNMQQQRALRSKVQSEILHRKITFYNTKVKNLKKEDCCSGAK